MEDQIKTTLHTQSFCLNSNCKAPMRAATGQGKPAPGDVSICIQCGNIAAFAEDLSIRALTDEEAESWARDPEIQRAAEKIRRRNARHN